MTFTLLFTAYVGVVVAGTVTVIFRWLTGKTRLGALALVGVWLTYAGILGVTGIVGRYHQLPPGIALLTLPIILSLLALTLTASGATLSRRIPLWLLIGFQVFRIGVEASLYHMWSLGLAPKLMTLAGGNIEILVAISAPVAAWLVSMGLTGRRIAWMWNLIGLMSLANIVIRAVLSAPGPLQFIHVEVPDMAILIFPFTFIPGFMAPLALVLHILAFRAFSLKDNAISKSRRAVSLNPELFT